MKHHKCPHCEYIYREEEDLYYCRKKKRRNREDPEEQNPEEQEDRRNNLRKWLVILLIIGIVVLIIGILGYYVYHQQNWVSAFYNATAVMSGIGAADTPSGQSAQIFASFYMLGVGLLYLLSLTVFVAIALREIDFFTTQ